MAESLSREEVAGIEWARWRESLDYQSTHASAWHDGFNAAWGALMDEIRPLVADLRTNSALRQSDMNEIINHRKAVIRLRELVREK